ncbi:YciI family protein [Nocardia sp. NPDC101769]|uniref:YciI family protein n=1 Tax=Nocardia sp. NPDC101769 TaxID=3364333 RepID=UPI00382F3EB6
MKFLLNLYLSAEAFPGEGFDNEQFLAAAGRAGELISGHVFADPSISAVVRVRDGAVTVTDGPYLQTPDHVAGQYLVDCESREHALELAALISSDRIGGVEVRPLMDSAGMEM